MGQRDQERPPAHNVTVFCFPVQVAWDMMGICDVNDELQKQVTELELELNKVREGPCLSCAGYRMCGLWTSVPVCLELWHCLTLEVPCLRFPPDHRC